MMLWLALLISIDGSRCEPCFRADVIELNHVTDECGGYCFSQIILWNWKPEVCRHHVDAWWMIDRTNLHLLPTRTSSGWRVYRFDGNGKRSIVSAKSYREWTTANDPERDDKKLWHETWRR